MMLIEFSIATRGVCVIWLKSGLILSLIQFGVTGSWVGFEDALVRVDPSSCSFTIRLLRDVELLRANEEWAGRILLAHDRIHTALEMRAGPGD